MPFSTTLTISDGSTNNSYGSIGSERPLQNMWRLPDASGDLSLGKSLEIAHSLNEKTQIQSTKVECAHSVVNSTTGKRGVVKARLVWEIPLDIASAAQADAEVKTLLNFLSASSYAALPQLRNLEAAS